MLACNDQALPVGEGSCPAVRHLKASIIFEATFLEAQMVIPEI